MNRAAAFLVLFMLTGCQSAGSRPPTSDGPTSDLHQGYALLYSTLKDESQLDKALLLKNPGDEVESLVKSIAQFASESRTRLDTFAREDATLNLTFDGLPVLEAETRNAISSATAKALLLSGGDEFARHIMLTQYEALKYIRHLAGELADRETVEARKRFLERVSDDAETRHELVIDWLRERH
jgi:hypothetical protein